MDAVPERCDVLVVGAGLAGAATALFLARAGVDVCLVERRSRAGEGGSGQGPGLLDLGVVEHPHRTIAAVGEDRARALFAFAARSRDLLAAEGLLAASGSLWAAIEPRELDAFAESRDALARLGIGSEGLGPAETDARVGGAGFAGGLALAGGGLAAEDAVDALVRAARQAGARVVWGAPAAPGPDDRAFRVGDHTVEAELCVLAAGVGCGGLEARLDAAVMPVRDASLRFPANGRPLGFGRAGQGWTAWRARSDGSVDVSGARWASPHLEVGEADTSRIDPRVRARLLAFASDRLGLGEPVSERAWLFAQSRDGLPLIGPLPGRSRVLALLGFGPNPATWALAAARAIADGVLGDPPDVPELLATRRLVRWSR